MSTSNLNQALGGSVIAILQQHMSRTAVAYGAWALAGMWSPPQVYVAGIPVSVKMQEAYQYRAEATKHAIEKGSPIVDHVILEPIRVDIHCEVSNWYPDMPRYSLDLLEKMWNDRIQVTLLTKHKAIENMVLVSMRAENEAPLWGMLTFELNFQQIPQIALETQSVSEESTTPAANGQTSTPDVTMSAVDATNRGQVQPQQQQSETLWNTQ